MVLPKWTLESYPGAEVRDTQAPRKGAGSVRLGAAVTNWGKGRKGVGPGRGVAGAVCRTQVAQGPGLRLRS